MSEPARAVNPASSSSRKPARPSPLRGGPNALQRLQSMAGNKAVTALVAQRLNPGSGGGDCVAPPVAPSAPAPAHDPQFAAAKKDIDAKAGTLKAHPPATKEVNEAQNAVVAPPDDKEAQAKAAHTGKMEAAKPGGFDKAAFVAAVNAAVAAKAPKNLDEADKFAQSGKADQVKNEVMGKVTAGKEASAKAIKDTTAATPDTGAAKDKPVTPMPPTPAPGTPASPDPKALAPKPAPPEQTQLGAGSCETTKKMEEAGVTEDQLAKSNESEFTGALVAKKTAEAHDATAPGAVRKHEGQVIAGAAAGAGVASKDGLGAMSAAKGGALQAAGSGKQATKSKDEGERARIAGEIKKIFDETKTDVEKILSGLDETVSSKFEAGEKAAKEAFTADHQARMSKYKWARYGGIGGPALWVKDQFLDLPAEANSIFLESKKLYETKMQAVIGDIADTVGAELAKAKARVADGRSKVQKFVADQPKNLQQLAGDAAKDIGSQFEDLEKSIDEKQSALVDDLAEKYVEARNAVDEEIKKLQEENKGLVGQAASAITGAVETIKKLKDMLLGVLARAANAVEKIIKDPMDFLQKFITAVKTGITNFMSNIVSHLKKGLQSWLFGALADAGIEIPEKFDLKGIISLLMSLLGLTWNSIRTRIVNVVGEKAMSAIEKGVDFIKVIVTEGLPGVWKFIAQKLSDLKDQVMGQIRDFVITKVITAGVTWLISLLNPAAAFIKACKMIYDAVMWFVDNAERLKEFVDSVLDSVESIAAGGVGKVASLIESTMGKAVPMLISGLASLLGLGGIAGKIKSILEKVQAPVGKAVDWLIGKAVKYGKKFLDKLKKSKLGKAFGAAKDKAKAAYAKGKAYVKKKYEAGKAWAKKKISGSSDGSQPQKKPGTSSRPFNLSGNPHTASIDQNGKVVIHSSPRSPAALVAEVRNLTKKMKEFDSVRSTLAGRMEAVLAAERALIATPASNKDAALKILTDAIYMLLSTKGRTATGDESRIPKLTTKKDGPRSISAAHYEVRVGSVALNGTAASVSGEFDDKAAAGEDKDSHVAAHEVGMPISLVTLRASDQDVLTGKGKPKKTQFGEIPDHWRGHDSELKLFEEIAFRLRPYLETPKNDFSPAAVRSTEATGNVWVHSDFVICPSCLNAIMNFKRRFPNIKLVVTSSSRLTPAGMRRSVN